MICLHRVVLCYPSMMIQITILVFQVAVNVDIKDAPRSERPTEIHDDKSVAVLKLNRRYTPRDIEETLV